MFKTCKRNLQDSGTLKRVSWGLDVGTRVWPNQYKSEFAFSLPLISFIYYCFIIVFKLFYLNQYLRNSLLREFITWIENATEMQEREKSSGIKWNKMGSWNPPIRERHMAVATKKRYKKRRGKMIKKPRKLSHVNLSAMGTLVILLYFSFII